MGKSSYLLVAAILGLLLFVAIIFFLTSGNNHTNTSTMNTSTMNSSTMNTSTMNTSTMNSSSVVFTGNNVTQVRVDVEVANTLAEQEYGLMNRTSLGQYDGMLFVFASDRELSFWMKDTLIPLDMVFVNRSGTIVDINKNAIPMSENVFTAKSPCEYVVEVNGGFCDQHSVRIGDAVIIPKY